MSNRVFFSWQSDTDSKNSTKYNTHFIRQAIGSAIKEVKNEYYYDESTRKQIGSVDITETLFEKIRNSTAFIADITTINSTDTEQRKAPNPNVALELGFASGILGWNYIILVFNLAKGNLQDVPFDIRNRRILTYNGNEKTNLKEEGKKLKDAIVGALKQMDMTESRKRDAVNRAFSSKSERIKFFALYNKNDEYWNVKLMNELLREELHSIIHEFDLVQKGILFNEPVEMSPYDFGEWTVKRFNIQLLYIDVFQELIENRLTDSVNSNDPIEILRFSQTIGRIGNKLIEFELERNSLYVHILLEVKKKKVGTNMDGFISLINKVIDVLTTFHLEEQDRVKLTSDDIQPLFNLDGEFIEEIRETITELMETIED